MARFSWNLCRPETKDFCPPTQQGYGLFWQGLAQSDIAVTLTISLPFGRELVYTKRVQGRVKAGRRTTSCKPSHGKCRNISVREGSSVRETSFLQPVPAASLWFKEGRRSSAGVPQRKGLAARERQSYGLNPTKLAFNLQSPPSSSPRCNLTYTVALRASASLQICKATYRSHAR